MTVFPRAPAAAAGEVARAWVLFATEFLLSATCYLLASYVDWGMEFLPEMFWEEAPGALMALTLSAQLWLARDGLYRRLRPRSKIELLARLSSAIGIAFLVVALMAYLAPGWGPALPVMALWGAFCLGTWFLWRLLYTALVWNPSLLERVLFVGADPVVRETARRLQELDPSRSPCLSIGFVDDHLAAGDFLHGKPVLGATDELAEVAAASRPDRIVLGRPDEYDRLPVRTLFELRMAGVHVEPVAELYEALFGRVAIQHLRPQSLLYQAQWGSRPRSVALQSVYTNLIALVAAVVLGPLMGILAIAVKLSSRGPVLERCTCVGFEGLPFNLFRFRCRRLKRHNGIVEFSATRVGRWLERLRLDRLPQLLNVLRGEMSLIGPRPHRLEYARVLSQWFPYYRQRHTVKPGLMGWEQINRKGSAEPANARVALEYDLYYIKHISASLDAYILLHSLL